MGSSGINRVHGAPVRNPNTMETRSLPLWYAQGNWEWEEKTAVKVTPVGLLSRMSMENGLFWVWFPGVGDVLVLTSLESTLVLQDLTNGSRIRSRTIKMQNLYFYCFFLFNCFNSSYYAFRFVYKR